MEISTIDVKTTFLYSPMKETIYFKPPPSLSPNFMPALVKLHKCLFELRQAAYEWRQILDLTWKGLGFLQLKTDACVYQHYGEP